MDNLQVSRSSQAMRRATASSARGLVERAALVETIALAAVAGEHVLVIGPPGTAKSAAARRMAQSVGGRYFEYLLGRFTEPSEIFGPVDLRRLREGVVATETAGMLPEADIAFLDEIFQGSTAILNTLLGVLNERVFRRGHTHLQCPLRVCVAASNALPQDEALAAFADRFLLRAFVESIPDPQLEDLLEGGWALGNETASAEANDGATLTDIDTLSQAARATDMAPVRPHLAGALRKLRAGGVMLSDRRAVKVQMLVAAAAVLDGRSTPNEGDLWPLILAVPTPEEQAIAREILRDVLSATQNASLPTAAEDASQGPLARAHRLSESARALLDAPPTHPDEAATHRLKLEGIAREIDAGFALEQLPPDLQTMRERLILALSSEAPA